MNIYETIGSLINVILGLIGTIAIASLFICIPLGIYYLTKREFRIGEKWDNRSGNGESSEVPSELYKWNWGAFALGPIWGLAHSVWFSLWLLIPIVNIPLSIYMGIKGNELAWQRNKWKSVDEFKKKQYLWSGWGIAIFILNIFIFLLSIAS